MQPTVFRAMFVCLLIWLPAALAGAGESGSEEERGTLEIRFEVQTRPGGETVVQGPAVISPFNIGLSVRADGVQVNDDGTFSFEARGTYRLDYHAVSPGVTIDTDEHRADRVQGKGKLAVDGKLSLDLAWGHGEGLQVWVTSVGSGSARQPATEAVPLPTWQLVPSSRETEELGPDSRRETVKYKASRPSRVVGTVAVPLTERMEIKHVRNTDIVPRG